jgi:enamine deaminase RidA (YjgF/YER057c/UK114 family)
LYVDIQYLGVEEWPDDVEQFHLTPIVRVGALIFVSGVTAPDVSNDLEAHLVAAFEAVAETLTVAGVGWEDVVKLTTYHVGEFRAHLELIFDVKDRYVKAPYPAWTGIGVSELADPDALIEIDVVAVVSV